MAVFGSLYSLSSQRTNAIDESVWAAVIESPAAALCSMPMESALAPLACHALSESRILKPRYGPLDVSAGGVMHDDPANAFAIPAREKRAGDERLDGWFGWVLGRSVCVIRMMLRAVRISRRG